MLPGQSCMQPGWDLASSWCPYGREASDLCALLGPGASGDVTTAPMVLMAAVKLLGRAWAFDSFYYCRPWISSWGWFSFPIKIPLHATLVEMGCALF